MKTHQYIEDMVIQAKKNNSEAYKASDEYSHAKKIDWFIGQHHWWWWF